MRGHTIWLTGIEGSGKSTIAKRLYEAIKQENKPVILLDNEITRKTLSFDLGYSKYDNDKHALRVVNVCYLITSSDILNIASIDAPNKKTRSYARSLIKDFTEVYVKCSEETAISSQIQGLYSRPLFQNNNFDEPYRPNIILDRDKYTIQECYNKLLQYLKERNII